MLKTAKRKKLIIFLVVCISVIFLSIFLGIFGSSQNVHNLSSSKFNVHNGGVVAESDTVIYSAVSADKLAQLLSIDTNAIACRQLPDLASNIQLSGEDAYFTWGFPGRIYRINHRGTIQMITFKRASEFLIENGNIYWRQNDSAGFFPNSEEVCDVLYRKELYGFKKTKIAENVSGYTAMGSKLFYIQYDDYALHCYDVDTKLYTKIHEGPISTIECDEKNIYYTISTPSQENTPMEGQLYRAELDGSNCVLMLNQLCWNLNLYDGYIYYRNQSEGGNLYRIKKDGTANQLLCEGNIGSIHVVNDMLLFKRITTVKNGIPAGWYVADLEGENEKLLE